MAKKKTCSQGSNKSDLKASKSVKRKAKNNAHSVSRKSYTVAFKRAAIKHFEATDSKNKTSKNLKIPRSCLINWINDKANIFNSTRAFSSRKMCDPNKKRKAYHPECEQRLLEWLLEQRNQCYVVSAEALQYKMMQLLAESDEQTASMDQSEMDQSAMEQSASTDEPTTSIGVKKQAFSASNGWLRRFLNRYGLVNRRISGSGKYSLRVFLIDLFETI